MNQLNELQHNKLKTIVLSQENYDKLKKFSIHIRIIQRRTKQTFRKCKGGQFKHRKCGNWVTAQYGFCPKCYSDRLERLEQNRIKKLSRPKGTMPKGYGQDTGYVFTDKPTMPKGWTKYDHLYNGYDN